MENDIIKKYEYTSISKECMGTDEFNKNLVYIVFLGSTRDTDTYILRSSIDSFCEYNYNNCKGIHLTLKSGIQYHIYGTFTLEMFKELLKN